MVDHGLPLRRSWPAVEGNSVLWVNLCQRQVPGWLVVPFPGSGLLGRESGSQGRTGTSYGLCPEPGLRKKT